MQVAGCGDMRICRLSISRLWMCRSEDYGCADVDVRVSLTCEIEDDVWMEDLMRGLWMIDDLRMR